MSVYIIIYDVLPLDLRTLESHLLSVKLREGEYYSSMRTIVIVCAGLLRHDCTYVYLNVRVNTTITRIHIWKISIRNKLTCTLHLWQLSTSYLFHVRFAG